MVLVTALAVAGCVPLWVGAGVVGVVGGYSVSPDTVEGTVPYALEEVWDTAKEIVSIMGYISEEGPNGTQVIATIGGSRVTVTLMSINLSTTKISVKARKAFMPKIDVAQDVYTKIVNALGDLG